MIGIARRRIPTIAEESSDGRGIIDNYGYVDLELPSGLLWATCNVGAATETEYGDYYQWGAITTSGDYDTQSSGTLPLEKDAAHVNMGGDWRMPTKEECQELIDNTTQTELTVDGINCVKFSKTVNGEERYVLFPKAGRNGGYTDAGKHVCVCSSTSNNTTKAFGLWFLNGTAVVSWYYGRGKMDSLSIRGVHQRS